MYEATRHMRVRMGLSWEQRQRKQPKKSLPRVAEITSRGPHSRDDTNNCTSIRQRIRNSCLLLGIYIPSELILPWLAAKVPKQSEHRCETSANIDASSTSGKAFKIPSTPNNPCASVPNYCFSPKQRCQKSTSISKHNIPIPLSLNVSFDFGQKTLRQAHDLGVRPPMAKNETARHQIYTREVLPQLRINIRPWIVWVIAQERWDQKSVDILWCQLDAGGLIKVQDP